LLTAAYAAEDGDATTAQPTLTGVEMFPLSDLREGMKGTGYTVIRGTKIEAFNVEVLELVPDGGFDGGPMILARFTGPVVDFSNGIAGGYSGSPVYIDNKLVGAVSMAMPYTDTHIGGITPISRMIKSLPDTTEADYSGNTVLPPAENSGTPIEDDSTEISYVDDYETARQYNDEMRAAGLHRYAAVPATTPVYFAGISPAVMDEYGDRLRELFGSRLQLMDIPMGHADDEGLFLNEDGDTPGLFLYQKSVEPPLKPGDACAVTFVEGDVELYGIGTVTYSDPENRFLIFGHMMMGEGQTDFPIGKAYITWVHSSIMRAFKQGVRLNTVGTITKDHAAACGGSFDIEPDMIPVRFKMKDVDLDKTETKRFRVIRHKDFTPLLIAMAMSQASSEVLDRQPGGTLKLSYHIEGVGLKEPMRRTNYYFDDSSVLFNGAFELMPIADLLENNIYRHVKIDKIEIMAEITRNRVNASIDDAEFILEDQAEMEEVTPEEAQDLEQIAEEMIKSAKSEMPGPESDGSETGPAAAQPDRGKLARLYSGHAPLGAAWQSLRASVQSGRGSPAQQNPEPAPEESTEPLPPGMSDTGYMMEEIPTFAPGDTIRVKVRLQPFRTDPIWREFSIQIPEDFPSGSSMLYIHGGGDLMSWNELGGKGRSLWGFGPIIDTRDFDLDSIIEQIVEAPLNNELLLSLARPYEYQEPSDPTNGDADTNGDNSSSDEEEEPEDHIDQPYQMEWVIYNSYMLPLNIQSEEDLAAMQEPQADSAGADNGEDEDEADDNDDNDDDSEDYETELPF